MTSACVTVARRRKAPIEPAAARCLRHLFLLCLTLAGTAPQASAHDLERTRVALTFARDGSFVLDVSNDPAWLKLRLESFPGPFTDRVVMFVDGREIRPTSVEYVPPAAPDALGTYRMRGRLPLDARTLRWYYGLVIDPYPLTIRRADRRLIVEEVGGDAWSRSIDVGGQFESRRISVWLAGLAVAGLLLVPLAIRFEANARRRAAPAPAVDRSPKARTLA